MIEQLAAFIGSPDWRSALLAALMALPWLWLLARGRLKGRYLWAAVAVGAALFPISIAWVQVPAQGVLSALWLRLLREEGIGRYLLLVGLPSLVVASLVQEGVKLLVAAAALRLGGDRRNAQYGLALGAAAGAGYGAFEAFWVFNLTLSTGWSPATVQLLGVEALLGLVERAFTVPFHIGATALAGYGYASGRPWRFLLLSVALHTLVNYAALLLQAGLLGIWATEAWIAAFALGTVGLALRLRHRSAPLAGATGG